jgi:hypothetical protein
MAALTAQLLKQCDEINGEASARALAALSVGDREEATRLLRKYASKKVVQKVALVRFSGDFSRKRTSEDWQLLDIES